jgi:hypothetical protein
MFAYMDTQSRVTEEFYTVKIIHVRSWSKFLKKVYIGLPGVRVEKGGALLTQMLLPHTQPKPMKSVNEMRGKTDLKLIKGALKRLSHEIDIKKFDKKLYNLA